MADTVDTLDVHKGTLRYIVRFTNISDGTGEAAVVKVDKSTLLSVFGAEPSKLIVEEIEYSIQGFTSVRLHWDHTTDDEISVLPSGSGFKTYKAGNGLVDPGSTGDTGDILLTTAGAVSGATYDITLSLRLKP